MLKESSVLGRSEDSGGTLHMEDAGSLRKGDAIVDRMGDGCDGVFLRKGDAGPGRMGDDSETCLGDSRMDDEWVAEVEDGFLWRCSGVVDISYA